jgi:hypothetical protein
VVTRVIQPSSDRPIIKDEGSPSVQFNSWLNLITGRALIISTGNPEGVVEAKQGAIYMDDAGTTGSIFYVKRDADISGDKTKGWILV